jgi:hypothetical protein
LLKNYNVYDELSLKHGWRRKIDYRGMCHNEEEKWILLGHETVKYWSIFY